MSVEQEIKNRLRQAVAMHEDTVFALSKRIEVNQATLNNQINLNTAVSSITLYLILKEYGDLSAEWLLRGIGNPTINAEQPIIPTTTSTKRKHQTKRAEDSVLLIEKLSKQLEEKERLIIEKETRLQDMMDKIKGLEADKYQLFELLKNISH